MPAVHGGGVGGGARLARICALVVACLSTAAALAEPVPVDRFVSLSPPPSRRGAFPEPAAGPGRLGRVPVPAPRARLRPLWTVQLQMRSLRPPVQASDGTLYVGGDRGIAALDEAGNVRFQLRLGPVTTPPTLRPDGSLLVVVSGRLLRIDPQGRHRELSDGLRVAGELLRLPSGHLVVGTPAGVLLVLDASGTRVLGVGAEPTRDYLPAAAGELVGVVGPPRTLSLFSLVGGLWRRLSLPHAALAAPVAGPDGTLWTVGDDGRLLGHGPRGRLRAEYDLGLPVLHHGPALGRDGVLRIGTSSEALVAVGDGGAQRFSLPLDGTPGPVVLAEDDVALLITRAGTLYVVEPDGTLRFRQGLRGRGLMTPVLGQGGRLYVSDTAGRVTAWQ